VICLRQVLRQNVVFILCRLHTYYMINLIIQSCVAIHDMLVYYGELLVPCLNPSLDNHPMLTLSTAATTLLIWRPFSPAKTSQSLHFYNCDEVVIQTTGLCGHCEVLLHGSPLTLKGGSPTSRTALLQKY
jgi:hypothetical protein